MGRFPFWRVFAAGLLCKRIDRGRAAIGTSVVLVLAAALASLMLPWVELGKVFPAWLCLAALAEFWRTPPVAARSPGDIASADMRWLLLIAASAFLTRMALNPRFFHYGYYQAALAGVVTMAAIFRSMPDLLDIRKSGRATYTIVVAVFLVSGTWQLEEISLHTSSSKQRPSRKALIGFMVLTPGSNQQPASWRRRARRWPPDRNAIPCSSCLKV